MTKEEIRHIIEDIPITGYSEELECFSCKDGSYLNLYRVKPKDLVNADIDEVEMDCFRWAKFYKTYGLDVEIITLMFPCDTGNQQRYWRKRLENNKNPKFQEMIELKVNELEWRERHTATKEFYLIFFYPTLENISENLKIIENTLEIGQLGLLEEMSREKKELILFKWANKNSLIF